jgi:hypothetical protein
MTITDWRVVLLHMVQGAEGEMRPWQDDRGQRKDKKRYIRDSEVTGPIDLLCGVLKVSTKNSITLSSVKWCFFCMLDYCVRKK